MGGHGGLNILPQKRWNVYNFDNREKVRQDEEAAAKEEQLKREQSRRRDAEFRLERLRATRGLAPLIKESESEQTPASAAEPAVEPESEPKSGHINLFEGIRIFDPIKLSETKEEKEYDGKFKRKKMKKEEAAPRVVGPEEETCRFGYGLAGKGVKLPWYLQKSNDKAEDEDVGHDGASSGGNEVKSVRKRILEVREKRLKRERLEKEREQAVKSRGDRGANEVMKKSGRKTIEELREERLKRERREKERERAVIKEKSRRDGGFSRR